MRRLSRRDLLRRSGVAGLGMAALLAGCQPKIVEVEKIVKETVEVEKVVKEAVEVEKEVTRVVEVEKEKVVEKEVTRVVEKMVSTDPTAFAKTSIRFAFRAGQKLQAEMMTTAFQTAQPNVDVELEPTADAFRKWQVMAAGGTLAEVLWIGNIVTWTFADAGIVIDMKPMAELDPDVPLNDIYEPLVKMCSFHDGWYMVPWAADAPVMYYNKTMFEEAGLPEPPQGGLTVDEFVQQSIELTNEAEQVYGTNIAVKWNAIHLAWFSGYGGSYWNEDKSQVVFDSPECAEAAQVLADLYNKYKCIVPLGADLGGDPFLVGRAGTVFTNRSLSKSLRAIDAKFEWDVALPVIEPDHHAAITGTMGPAVSSAAAEHDMEQIAYELATSILTPPVQKYFARDFQMIPVLESLAKDPSWYDLPAPPSRRDVFLDVLDIAETLPLPETTFCGTPTWGFMFDTLDQAWDEMIVGQVPAEEALEKAADLINECLANKGM